MKLLPRFEHRPGVHCGSTAMADVLRHQGHDLSEAMCFGLGAGLGLAYLRDFGIPSRVFHGRTLRMEEDLCQILDVRFDALREPDVERAWRRVRDRVDEGRAVVLQTDVRFLPHYRSTLPFNGHRVVLAGYDETDETALVADTHFPELVPVPQPELRKARASDGPPAGWSANLWWELEAPATLPDLAERARLAMRRCGEKQLDRSSEMLGLRALERFADELPTWGALADVKTCAHFGWQVIERRGTGGSLFRRLYHRFLAEATERWPGAVPEAATRACAAAADAWTALAEALRRAAGEVSPDFTDAAAIARRLVEQERELAERLAAC